jgi:plastocyanin
MKKIVFVLIVGLSLVLSACGAAKPATTINVSLTDFQFQPASAAVPAGKEITFNGTNTGAVVHNYVIMKLGTTAGDIFDEEDLANVYWEVELPPGQDAHVTFTAPSEPGEYQVVCRTQGHIASGMTGTLKVVAEE